MDDHLPLIAAGATICFVIVIALFTCWIVKKRNRKNEGKNKRSVLRRQSRDTNRNMKRLVYCQYG